MESDSLKGLADESVVEEESRKLRQRMIGAGLIVPLILMPLVSLLIVVEVAIVFYARPDQQGGDWRTVIESAARHLTFDKDVLIYFLGVCGLLVMSIVLGRSALINSGYSGDESMVIGRSAMTLAVVAAGVGEFAAILDFIAHLLTNPLATNYTTHFAFIVGSVLVAWVALIVGQSRREIIAMRRLERVQIARRTRERLSLHLRQWGRVGLKKWRFQGAQRPGWARLPIVREMGALLIPVGLFVVAFLLSIGFFAWALESGDLVQQELATAFCLSMFGIAVVGFTTGLTSGTRRTEARFAPLVAYILWTASMVLLMFASMGNASGSGSPFSWISALLVFLLPATGVVDWGGRSANSRILRRLGWWSLLVRSATIVEIFRNARLAITRIDDDIERLRKLEKAGQPA